MKFEKLNQEKFEKIEKNELGMLVGGACPGYTASGAGEADLGSGGTVTWSEDWDNREYDADGNVTSGGIQFMDGKDMACPAKLKDTNIGLG
ncbi:MAG: hypothetical protein PHW82_15225 [Bacteroidales bacterium]|jgi:hypothetical protein|nr:hypothetical protein [Bacteroidales bacterium]MDY0142353.1 hypothetical protein [Bacteroidales bacterium]